MAASMLKVAMGTASRALSSGARAALWKLGRLNHVAIAVPAMDEARAFYRDVLGARVSEPVALPEHGVLTAFVELGGAKLELLEPLGPDSPVRRFLDRNRQGGVHHVCIEVDHLAAAIQQLRARQVRTLSPEARIGAHGKPVIFLHPKDCGGVLVELEEA
uniref:methylmalonyl-CoA epimerase, mitochondrial n=1 Tax=Pristiophorus japonicus TaxID=55135 RepID=UPI00398F0468